jgi:hypothetical protein
MKTLHSGIWHCVVWVILIHVSGKLIAAIIRITPDFSNHLNDCDSMLL